VHLSKAGMQVFVKTIEAFALGQAAP